jgi:3',5'-cyclic-AMP phosphodiesterase
VVVPVCGLSGRGGDVKIIHVTDLHLSAPGERVWGLDSCDRADRVLDDIARSHGDAAFCVVTGDLANDRDRRAYAWLAGRLARFPLRTFLMTGNHDERAAMRTELPDVMDDGQGFVQGVHETPEGVFLFLDTLKDPTVTSGQYCARRQGWLRARLAEAAGRPVYVFMHHPPFDIGIDRMDRIKLEDAEAFSGIVKGHDIRHIFFGHVHRPIYVSWRGIPCTALPGTSHQIPLVEAAAGAFTVEPPMYAVVLIRDGGVVVSMDAPLDRHPVPGPP